MLRTALAAALLSAAAIAGASPAEATRTTPAATVTFDLGPDLCRNRGDYAKPGVQDRTAMGKAGLVFVPGSEANRLGRRDCRKEA